MAPTVGSEAALRAAVVLASCTTHMPVEYTLAQLAQRVYPAGSPEETKTLADCIDSRLGGCQAIADCLAMTVDRDVPTSTRCDGEIAETSLGNDRTRVDCGRLGKSCVVIGALAECVETSTEECEPNTPASCSADGRPVRCRGGHAQYSVACSTLGLTCTGDGALTYCSGSAGACAAIQASADYVSYDGERCAGDNLVACVGGREATVDCSTSIRDASCWTSGDAQSAYCGLGNECAPDRAASAECDGNRIVVCNLGRVERIDCTALGFARCESRRSVFGDAYAACAP
jgi:hypothetical protein